MSHLSTVALDALPYQFIYQGCGYLPTGIRPALFLMVSAGLVSTS
jgi:hypothetical protein